MCKNLIRALKSAWSVRESYCQNILTKHCKLYSLVTKRYFVGNKAKGRIPKRVFQKNKARQIFRKTNISNSLIRTRTWRFKVKKLYNSHNDVVYVPKKIRKVETPEKRLFCEIEAFPKQTMVSEVIPKTGKTSIFFV